MKIIWTIFSISSLISYCILWRNPKSEIRTVWDYVILLICGTVILFSIAIGMITILAEQGFYN